MGLPTKRTRGSADGSASAGPCSQISAPVPRCAITTQDPDTGERDLDTLRTIIAYRGLTDDRDIDFGVYGEVEQPGRIRLGDSVEVLTAAPRAAAAS